MTKPVPPLIGYARDAADDPDLRLQMAELVRFGVRPADIFVDEAGREPISKRPAFEAMSRKLSPGSVLVIWRLDRLGRDLSELVQNAEKIHETGAHLSLITENIDSRTEAGWQAFEVVVFLARLERNLTRERARIISLAHGAQGKPVGRPSDLTDEKRAEIVSLLLSGLNFVQISKRVGLSKSTLYNHKAALLAEAAILAAGNDAKGALDGEG
ncbi:recombinase family protein [Bosea sp. RAC05]|uniref:recombinase family protein n=1 Tax=Bosea sp. RAC05 TaxID=1842539 RepID=UPI00083E6A94|nr:recombinase family protein [Bosea sp. RAC05]AOG03057.1 hypothetical protein BSY19_5140 [Bosea sp. RAC05]